MNKILELKNIFYSYHSLDGEIQALRDISFSVKKGEFVAIVGPSGCGKSTLLHLISNMLKPEKGRIIMDSSIKLGYMLQKDELLEWRTIYKNILLGLEIQHMLSPQMKVKARRMLEKYGLALFADANPSELSGGMRQRAALIRTLILNPDILLLDEPFSALDYQTRLSVANDIGQIIKQESKTAILVTHDLSEAVSLADKIIILTARPATIRQTVDISFDIPNLTPLERRDRPEFKSYFNLIWKELNAND